MWVKFEHNRRVKDIAVLCSILLFLNPDQLPMDGIGQVMSSARFPPEITLRIEAKQFNLGFITLENLVSHSLRVF